MGAQPPRATPLAEGCSLWNAVPFRSLMIFLSIVRHLYCLGSSDSEMAPVCTWPVLRKQRWPAGATSAGAGQAGTSEGLPGSCRRRTGR